MWGYIFVFIIAILLMKVLDKLTQKNSNAKASEDRKITEFKGHYQAKYLLSKNEWNEYKKLKQYAEAQNLQICPKVRLLDIIEPRIGDPNYIAYMGKIKSKHVDFVICDQNLHIKGILELDDKSHDRADRQERDKFVDEILEDVGYKIIHTRSVTPETLDPIINTKHQIFIEHSQPTFEEWKAEQQKKENS